MSSKYFVLDSKNVANAVSLADLAGFDDDWELVEGEPLVDSFPDNVTLKMNPDLPNDTVLVDNLINPFRIIVGSATFKSVLEEQKLEKLEFLPITILDHKKRKIKEKYFILHPIEPVHCIDFDKSVVTWSKIQDDAINSVEKLVLDESKIGGRRIFRLNNFFNIVLVERELMQIVSDAGITGIWWRDLSEI